MLSTQYIIIIVSIILFSITFYFIWRLESRLRKIFRGKSGGDMEDVIKKMNIAIDDLYNLSTKMSGRLDVHDTKLGESIRGIGTVRFNPFGELGSNQSFAIALLNEKNDGVVISSLYTRERVSVFAKPIKNMQSEYELSDEEKEALAKAKL